MMIISLLAMMWNIARGVIRLMLILHWQRKIHGIWGSLYGRDLIIWENRLLTTMIVGRAIAPCLV